MSMELAVEAGDVQGRGTVYGHEGALMVLPGESVLSVAAGWDMHVWSPWKGLHPKVIFLGFNKRASSRLFVTSERVVLIREIDPWREVAGEMTPLGIPSGIAKDARLKDLRAAGVRQYCQVRPRLLTVAGTTRSVRKGSRLRLRAEDRGGVRYAITYWKTDGRDDTMLSMLASLFQK